MREYSRVSPSFWTGETGKKIRALGRDAQVLALYLMTSPSANMIGVFYCPILYMSHETGIALEGSSKDLQSPSEGEVKPEIGVKDVLSALESIGFCKYDAKSEFVWVPEMARYQIGPDLKKTDNQVKGIKTQLKQLSKNPFTQLFVKKYGAAYHLIDDPGEENPPSPSEGPPKPGTGTGTGTGSGEREEEEANASLSEPSVPACPHRRIVERYHKILPELQGVVLTRWTDSSRAKALQARWRESPKHQELRFWTWFFSAVRTNLHWMGENDRKWSANLGWLLKRENFDKVIEWAESHKPEVSAEMEKFEAKEAA